MRIGRKKKGGGQKKREEHDLKWKWTKGLNNQMIGTTGGIRGTRVAGFGWLCEN